MTLFRPERPALNETRRAGAIRAPGFLKKSGVSVRHKLSRLNCERRLRGRRDPPNQLPRGIGSSCDSHCSPLTVSIDAEGAHLTAAANRSLTEVVQPHVSAMGFRQRVAQPEIVCRNQTRVHRVRHQARCQHLGPRAATRNRSQPALRSAILSDEKGMLASFAPLPIALGGKTGRERGLLTRFDRNECGQSATEHPDGFTVLGLV